jgi:hypothetical protein
MKFVINSLYICLHILYAVYVRNIILIQKLLIRPRAENLRLCLTAKLKKLYGHWHAILQASRKTDFDNCNSIL